MPMAMSIQKHCEKVGAPHPFAKRDCESCTRRRRGESSILTNPCALPNWTAPRRFFLAMESWLASRLFARGASSFPKRDAESDLLVCCFFTYFGKPHTHRKHLPLLCTIGHYFNANPSTPSSMAVVRALCMCSLEV